MAISAKTPLMILLGGAMLLALPGCGVSDEGPGPGGVTAGEAEALNKAAAMLDRRAENAQAALNVQTPDEETPN